MRQQFPYMKKKVALVTGGLSSEAQISYKSAQTVMNALDKNKYDVYLLYLLLEL